jgi:hypothetical protein
LPAGFYELSGIQEDTENITRRPFSGLSSGRVGTRTERARKKKHPAAAIPSNRTFAGPLTGLRGLPADGDFLSEYFVLNHPAGFFNVPLTPQSDVVK